MDIADMLDAIGMSIGEFVLSVILFVAIIIFLLVFTFMIFDYIGFYRKLTRSNQHIDDDVKNKQPGKPNKVTVPKDDDSLLSLSLSY